MKDFNRKNKVLIFGYKKPEKNKQLKIRDVKSKARNKKQSGNKNTGENSVQKIFRRIIFYGVAVCFCGEVVYTLFFSYVMEINTVNVIGAVEIHEQEIRSDIQKVLEQKYFNYIPKDNLLLFPSRVTEKNIREKFKRIEKVKVQKIFPHTLSVNIVEYPFLVEWCTGGPCYMVTSDGIVTEWLPADSQRRRQNTIMTVVDKSAQPVQINQKIMSQDYYHFIGTIIKEIEGCCGFKIKNQLSTIRYIAQEIELETADGIFIKINTEIPLSETINTLRLFLKKSTETEGEEENNIDYIDLRTEGRIFYVLKNDPEKEQKDQ